MARLRVSLTIPGALSLGAYEGGASLHWLSLRNKFSLVALLFHTARVVLHDLRTGGA